MEYFGIIVLIGLIATTNMTIFLYLVHALKISKTNMLDALGILFVEDAKKARRLGMVVHYFMGVSFTFLYMWAANYIGFSTKDDFMNFGIALGILHGVAFSSLLVVVVTEHHPLEEYRKHGFAVVLAYGIAHVIYGISIGGTAIWLDPNFEFLKLFQ